MAEAGFAVVTTRIIDINAEQYRKQEDGIAVRLRLEKESDQTRPYLFYGQNTGNINKGDHFLVQDENIHDENLCKRKVQDLLGLREVGKAVLYIHGFNSSNEGAVEDGLAIQRATRNTPVIVFDWDSTHDLKVIPRIPFIGRILPDIVKGYAKDSETASGSVRSLNWLLYILLRGIGTLDIIAHSMGSRILIGSINSIAHDARIISREGENHPFYGIYTLMLEHIGKIVFKQPDVDIVSMSRLIRRDLRTLRHVNNSIRVIIYAHKRDNALGFSEEIHYNIQRVGQLCGAKQLIEILPDEGHNFNVVDASPCKRWSVDIRGYMPYANHNYFKYQLFEYHLYRVISDEEGLLNEGIINTL